MDIFILTILIIVIMTLTVFNYYLNLAPGADPEDFQIGPRQLNMTCDCSLNTLILGGILVIALSAGSGMFESRIELYVTGIVAFTVVSIAGIIGRRRRYREWKEFDKVIRRAIPKTHLMTQHGSPVDIIFDEEPDDEDDSDYEDF
ncbi:MAG: hypothetical protein OEV85_10545 [Candidatus Thorarchaeota archaeon]|nr:hypothetical protein [Candidatus Thorarchaeota archaeon]